MDPGGSSGHRHISEIAPELRRTLLAWWEVHGRKDMAIKPWMFTADGRWPEPNEDLSPYGIWIAEVMLQQTQLRVMRPYWEQWMLVLSTVQHLAAAEERQVLLLWQGLGYYSRARRLHQAARQLAASPLTSSLEAWQAVSGIGRTTAGSILSSALNRPVPILDGNVRRVLARLHACLDSPQRAQVSFWQWSEALLDPLRPRDFNQALMDLGALVCTPRSPSCQLCPWQRRCAAYAAGEPSHFPVKDASKPIPFQLIGVGVVLNEAGEVLIDQRLNEGLLGGLWEFPGGKQEPGEAIEATIARELREELAIEVQVGEQLIALDHAYSHKKLRFVVHLCRWIAGEPKPLASQQVCWVKPEDLSDYPFPAANARMIAALIDHLRADMLSQRS